MLNKYNEENVRSVYEKSLTGKILSLLILIVFATGCSTGMPARMNPKTLAVDLPKPHNPCRHTETAFHCVRVVAVYDGDTIFIDLPEYHPLFGSKIGVRILGIDTPELRSKDNCEKSKAKEAKAVLEDLIRNAKRVDIVNVRRDKYFRVLGTVEVDGSPVAYELMKRKLAYSYHGEKKQERNWCK